MRTNLLFQGRWRMMVKSYSFRQKKISAEVGRWNYVIGFSHLLRKITVIASHSFSIASAVAASTLTISAKG